MIAAALLLWFAGPVSGQVLEGVVLSVEEGLVYIDLKAGQVNVGDNLKVIRPGGVMTHPVTGEKIQKKDEVVANISLTQVHDTYSVGEVYPKTAIDLIKPWAVDVASGVEKAPGVKDLRKVEDFIRATREGKELRSEFWL